MKAALLILLIWAIGAAIETAFAKCEDVSRRVAVNVEETQQISLGSTCSDTKIPNHQRIAACAKLAEFMKSDAAEFRMADDEFILLLEKDPQFFFSFFEERQDLFAFWLRAVPTSAFVAPYLYSDTTRMEQRRVCLIERLSKWKTANEDELSMKNRILVRLTTTRVRIID